MKKTRKLIVFLAVASSLQLGHAAQLSWDPSLTPAIPSGGAGTWDLVTANWSNGASDLPWTDTVSYADTATFGGTAGTVTLSGTLAAKGLVFTAPGYTLSGGTLTLGPSGIDASALSSGTTALTGGLTLSSGQSWNVGTGSTLALSGGTFTRNGKAVLTLSGAGTVTSSLTGLSALTNNILGPWAIVGTGTSARYATVNGSSIVGGTYAASGGSPVIGTTGATFGYTTNAAANYEVTAIAGPFGSSRSVNTVRYTGPAGTLASNSTQTYTFNGLMNAGSGTLVVQTTAGSGSILNVAIGGTNELVLATPAASLTINSIISGAAGAGITVSGPNTVTLNGVNTFTGPATVSSGTLSVAGAGSINAASGITVNGSGAKYLHASSVASTRAITLTTGTLDGTGTVGAVTVGDDTGAVVANGNGGNTALATSSLTFNGGATVNVRSATTAAGLTTGALSTSGANGTVVLNATNTWSTGATYNLIGYTSFSGSLSDFTKGTITGLGSRQTATLVNTGTAIGLAITGEKIVWTGLASGAWTTNPIGGIQNWKTQTAGTGTEFLAADDVVFDDTAAGATTIDISTANVDTSGVTVNNATKAYTINSSGGFGISSGSLVKSGAANLTLTTTNAYSGTTTINGGTLTLGNGTTDGTISNTASVTNNGALVFNWTGTRTAGYPITGTGSVTKQGAGTLTLSGASTYTGGTTISGGRLNAAPNSLNGGPISIGTGTTLTFNASQTSSSTVTGAGAILNDTGSTVLFTGDHTGFTGTFTHNAASNNTQFNSATAASENAAYTLTAGELIFATSGDYTVKFGSLASAAGNIRGGNTATGTTTLEVGHLGTSTTLTGTLNNGTTKVLALNKVGAGSLSMAGTNTYGGATNITGGTLTVTGTGAINATSGITINGSGAKYLHASTTAGTRPITVTTGTLDGTGSVGAVTVGDDSGAILTHGNGGTTALATASLTFNGGANVNLKTAGTTAGITTGALTTTGANGTVVLTPVNNWSIGSTYNLISYTSFSGTLADFALGTLTGLGPRQTASLVDTGSAIAVSITGDKPAWTGATSGEWSTNTIAGAKNWKIPSSGTPTDFLAGDEVLFDDTATGTTTVDISAANVNTASVTVNTATKVYTIGSSGGFGIASGAITKTGAANLILTSANTYTGATIISAGTLTLGNGTADGTIANTSGVTNNAALAYNWAGDHTAPYIISGTGVVTKTGAGNLTFTGANTYSGGTTINGGTLTTNSTGSVGAGAVAIGAAGTWSVGNNYTLSNTVTGTGAIATTGATVSGNFSGFSGTVTHNNSFASTSFSNATATSKNAAYVLASNQGSAQGFIAGGAGDQTLELGSLSGVTNSLFRGGNSVSGTTTLQIGNLNTSTTFAGLFANGTTKIIAINKVGTGTLTLTGANVHTGATTVSAGTLQLGDGTTDGTIANTSGVTNNAALVYNWSTAHTAPYVISGTGFLTKTGAGTLVLTGTNTYTGATLINGGILQLGNGTTDGTIAATSGVANNGTLAYNWTTDHTASYVISGSGGLTKDGAGTLTLGGVNTYTGGTTVNAGKLAVNGSSLANGGALIVNGGLVDVTGNEVVDKLFFGTTQQLAGTYGATGSGATFIDNTHFSGTGVLTVTSSPTAYDSWALSKGLTNANNGPTQDPDNDGIPNLLEYVLGGNPLASLASVRPVQSDDGSNIVLTFSRSDASEGDVTLNVEWSANLITWTDIPVTATTSSSVFVQENDAFDDTVSVAIPKSNAVNGKLFVRLKATK
ncbi:autotransporter-associated beta strand repeat-containing protein [Luteolibacter sp. LG18]|uniref:beta strand repeat-containing protein n=1 Tax=Luteolibacter sp. LG18 TaxID=2819286 RepID=UPI002B2C03EC|nr:hypothetical protein llg_44420 [Luteolibacter sp. LG18]